MPANKTPYLYFAGKFGLKVTDSISLGTYKLEDIYNFFGKSATAFTVDGMGVKISGIPVPAFYTDKDEIYKLPLSYKLAADSSTFYFKTVVPTVLTYIKAGSRINQVDGYGTIITPYGTFQCIRVKTTILEIDSVKLSIIPFPIGFPNNQVEYKWLAKGLKIPVLEVTATMVGTNVTISKVRFRDKYRKISSATGPQISFMADKTIASTSDSIFFTNKTSGLANSYIWSFSPNFVLYLNGTTSTSANPIVSLTQTGFYDVSLHAQNLLGANDTIVKSYININTTGIEPKLKNKTGLSVYPIPLNGNVLNMNFFNSKPAIITVKLCDITGKTQWILKNQFEQSGAINYTFNLEKLHLSATAYILEVSSADFKFVKVIFK